MPSRRVFLHTAALTGGTVLLARFRDDAVARAATFDQFAGGRPPAALAADEDFWFHVKQAFAIDRNIINFNNGGVCPSPRIVMDAMRRHLEFTNIAPPWALWKVQDPEVESVRRRLARHFGCDAEELAITRNTSESLEICLFGFDLKAGDEVLATNQDYPRMLNTIRQREAREGVVLKTFSVPTPPTDMDQLVDQYEHHLSPRTKLILVSHIVNITGQIFPVRRIVELGRARGVPVVVDGAHAFSHFQYKRDDLACDLYGTSLHKWLTAPIGTGFLYVRKQMIPKLWPLMAAPAEMREDVRKYEEIGTHPAANRLAIGEALTFFEGIGAARKENRLRFLRDAWAKRLMQDKRFKLITSLDPAMSCGIGVFQIRDVDSAALQDHLWNRYRILVTAIKHDEFHGVRVTPNVYSTLAEVDTFCRAVEDVLANGLPA